MILVVICLVIVILLVVLFIPKLNRALYKPARIWDIALFHIPEMTDIVCHDYSSPNRLFTPRKKVRTKYHCCTGYADPFLFVKDDYLYLFHEHEIYGDEGSDAPKSSLCAFMTKDLIHWKNVGVVLQEPIHLSYPNVFEYEGEVFMIPETCAWNAVVLYKAASFPNHWKKVCELVNGERFVDSCLLQYDGKWFLFTTVWHSGNEGLRIYVSDNMTDGFVLHPASPISTDVSNMRCGGAVFEAGGHWYRPAQYNVNGYGGGIALYEITKLTPTEYEEHFVRFVSDPTYTWSEKGAHHFNTTIFRGERIVVTDGRQRDNFINNRTRKFFRKC